MEQKVLGNGTRNKVRKNGHTLGVIDQLLEFLTNWVRMINFEGKLSLLKEAHKKNQVRPNQFGYIIMECMGGEDVSNSSIPYSL